MKAGVVILSVMSAVWIVWAQSALHAQPWAYAAAGLLALAPLLLSATRRFPPATAEQVRRRRRLVGAASLAEVVAIVAGIPLLAHAGRPDLVVCLVAAAVGLHFLPLARWLPAPVYALTGAALTALAAVGLALPATDRIVLVAGGASAILWLTAWSLVLPLPRREPDPTSI